MNKNQTRTIIGLVIVFVAFTVLAFALPFKMNGLFWVSYLFAVIAIGIQFYVIKIALLDSKSAKSKYYGFPIIKIGVIYLLAQIVISLIFMALAAICPTWVGILVDVLLLAAAAFGLVAADAVKEVAERQDQKVVIETSMMKGLRDRAAALPSICEDGEAKKVLGKLAEEFRYSDPVSGETTKHIEARIEGLMGELENAVKSGEVDRTKELGQKVMTGLVERNRMCKMGKR